jgi:acetyltransferase-like isoleucine patch superfamily enzyme
MEKMKKIKRTNPSWPHDTVIVTVGENVSIAPEATIYQGVTIGSYTTIGAYATIDRDVKIGNSCRIGKNSRLDVGVVMGDRAVVADDIYVQERVRLGAGVRIMTPGARFGVGAKITASDQYITVPPTIIPWQITVTPTLTTIGCQTHTRAEWLAFTREQGEIYGLTVKQYDRLAVLLPALFAIIPEQKPRRR